MNEPRTDVLDYVRSRLVQAPTVIGRMISADRKVGVLRPRSEFEELLQIMDGYRRHGKEHMVLISGIRGAGKSTLMAQAYKALQDDGVSPSRMLYISLDDSMLAIGAGVMEVFSAFEQLIPQDLLSIEARNVVVMLDEVQYDPKWSQAVKVIYDRYPDVLLIVTGSSALQLREQGDLARRGRFIDLPPLQLGEYLKLAELAAVPSADDEIANALFNSKSAQECYGKLSHLAGLGKGFDVAPGTMARFLSCGSLPIGIGTAEAQVIGRTYIQLLEKVIFIDMPGQYGFDRETALRISHMVNLLADSDRISYEKIGAAVGLSKGTITVAMRGLEQAGIIIPLRGGGGEYARKRTAPRYKFTAPAMRAAMLDRLGRPIDSPETYGILLEDAVVEKVAELIRDGVLVDMWSPSAGSGVDLMVKSRDGKTIGIEIGWGRKDAGQAASVDDEGCKYCLVASASGLQIRGEVVLIPRELVLLA